jgi:hypothetical protein
MNRMILSSTKPAARSASRRFLESSSRISCRSHTTVTPKGRLTRQQPQQQQQNKSTLALNVSNTSARNSSANSASNSNSKQQAAQHKLTPEQVRSLFLSACIPMVGFGFMDNFIMITAGTAIDNSLGVHMGLATMTAAAIGQVVSDVSGVVFGDTLSKVFKVAPAKLTSAQKTSKLTRSVVSRLRLGGAVIGVVAGCTLGAVALWLIPDNGRESDERTKAKATSASVAAAAAVPQERIRDQLDRLQKVMTDVMTNHDDKWHDRRASCTLYVNESTGRYIPPTSTTKTTMATSFFADWSDNNHEKLATIKNLANNNDPEVLHTLKEGRVVVFANTIYVPVLGEDNNSNDNSNKNILGIFKIKLENGSFYTGSEIKDAKRVARNLGFFLNHMV